MGTPTRSRLGSASRFGTSDRPATSTGLLNRPSSSSSFHKPSTTTARSSLAHVTPIAERPSRVRPNTASNTASTTTTSRPMSATKTRLMGQYASLGKLAMATPRGGKENVGSNIPGSARKRPTTPRDLYDYNGRRIDPNGPRKAFTPRSTNRPNRRAFDEDDDEDEERRTVRREATGDCEERRGAERPS